MPLTYSNESNKPYIFESHCTRWKKTLVNGVRFGINLFFSERLLFCCCFREKSPAEVEIYYILLSEIKELF
jgi:hypothetical protein